MNRILARIPGVFNAENVLQPKLTGHGIIQPKRQFVTASKVRFRTICEHLLKSYGSLNKIYASPHKLQSYYVCSECTSGYFKVPFDIFNIFGKGKKKDCRKPNETKKGQKTLKKQGCKKKEQKKCKTDLKKKCLKKKDDCKKKDPCEEKKEKDTCTKPKQEAKKKEEPKKEPCKKEQKKEEPCKKEEKKDTCSKEKKDPCKKKEKKKDSCSKQKEDPCKKKEKKDSCSKKKEDPCKKKEKKKDSCSKQKEDPCKKKEKKKDSCSKKKEDPCKKKEDPCKKKEKKKDSCSKKKEDPCKKKEDPCKKKEDPCKKKEKKKDSCSKKKEDPCKKKEKKKDSCSKKKEDPCKKKEDPCKKKEKKKDSCSKKKEDPCKKKEDPCKKKEKKKDSCSKKKEDPCKKKEDPCKKKEKKKDSCSKQKEDPCKKKEKKKDSCSKQKEDPCKKKEKKDPCQKKKKGGCDHIVPIGTSLVGGVVLFQASFNLITNYCKQLALPFLKIFHNHPSENYHKKEIIFRMNSQKANAGGEDKIPTEKVSDKRPCPSKVADDRTCDIEEMVSPIDRSYERKEPLPCKDVKPQCVLGQLHKNSDDPYANHKLFEGILLMCDDPIAEAQLPIERNKEGLSRKLSQKNICALKNEKDIRSPIDDANGKMHFPWKLIRKQHHSSSSKPTWDPYDNNKLFEDIQIHCLTYDFGKNRFG